VGRDVGGESLRYQGSNGTSYLTMVFQTEQALDRWNGLNDWNGLNSKTMAWASSPWL
jgi:hypothetical protein